MAKRERIKLVESKSSYFTEDKEAYQFVSSGCAVLDCVLGGGYPLGRMANIIGDKSTAKTALATEALINFVRQYPEGAAAYRDIEAAFDRSYAEAMGLPVDKISFGEDENPILTVEAFVREFNTFLDQRIKTNTPGIYVIDSLDALSDEAEMERDVGEATYGGEKPKQLSTFFRKTARKIETSKVLLLVISQVRDNIGVKFGEKLKRAGGKAMDFYASQCLWLAHTGIEKRVVNKVQRPVRGNYPGQVQEKQGGLPIP